MMRALGKRARIWAVSRLSTKCAGTTALLCALSPSVDAIIGFRAGWGLGNALFISTALATIVGAASGGSEAAIILYEAALGIGIAVGPLLGGLLVGPSLAPLTRPLPPPPRPHWRPISPP